MGEPGALAGPSSVKPELCLNWPSNSSGGQLGSSAASSPPCVPSATTCIPRPSSILSSTSPAGAAERWAVAHVADVERGVGSMGGSTGGVGGDDGG